MESLLNWSKERLFIFLCWGDGTTSCCKTAANKNWSRVRCHHPRTLSHMTLRLQHMHIDLSSRRFKLWVPIATEPAPLHTSANRVFLQKSSANCSRISPRFLSTPTWQCDSGKFVFQSKVCRFSDENFTFEVVWEDGRFNYVNRLLFIMKFWKIVIFIACSCSICLEL